MKSPKKVLEFRFWKSVETMSRYNAEWRVRQEFIWLSMIPYHIYGWNGVMQTSRRGLGNSVSTSSVNLTWGRVTHICVSKLTIIGSDNGLSPGRRQAIIWTNAGILLIRTVGTNFRELLSKIHAFSFKKMHLKMSSAKWRPFCLGLNVLTCGLASIPDSHYITVWMMVQIYHAISFQWSQYSVSLAQLDFSQTDKRL